MYYNKKLLLTKNSNLKFKLINKLIKIPLSKLDGSPSFRGLDKGFYCIYFRN